MLLTEYNEKRHMKTVFEEGRQSLLFIGIPKGYGIKSKGQLQ